MVQAQYKTSNSTFMFSTGTNHFMGELGGGKKSPTPHFMGIRDLDVKSTRPTWQIAYRYKFTGRKKGTGRGVSGQEDLNFLQYLAVRGNFTYALLSGHDKLSKFYGRESRNLTFRSSIYEFSGQVEYYFVPEKQIPRSRFESIKQSQYFSAYLFFGFGFLFYNPKAKNEAGKWIALQPLGTEGQYANPDGTPYTYTPSRYIETNGDLQTPKPYKRIAANISFGIGMKYKLNRKWAIGLEISNRYTSSDYLDDVSDRYFDYSEFGLEPPSPETAYFADRHLTVDHENKVVLGEDADNYLSGKSMRGSPRYNDAYILTLVTVYYTLKKSKWRGLPKHERSKI